MFFAFMLLQHSGEHSANFVCWLIAAILLGLSVATSRSWWGPNPSTPYWNSPLVVLAFFFFVLGFLIPLW